MARVKNNIIDVKNVVKSFGDETIHDHINLSVPTGKTTIIVGPSGTGKSQLIRYILGLGHPDSGEITVKGKRICQLSTRDLKEVRASFGVVFQNSALLDFLTVFENVALPLQEKTRLSEKEIYEKVMHILREVDVEKAAHKYISEISGGMKKRVALARALIEDAEIILFDEPTTGLDPETKENMYDLIQKIQKKLKFTALIVSHDIPKIFRIADYVGILYEGKMSKLISAKNYKKSKNEWFQRILKIEGSH